eukprot:1588727-Rhodomonas_salina.1
MSVAGMTYRRCRAIGTAGLASGDGFWGGESAMSMGKAISKSNAPGGKWDFCNGQGERCNCSTTVASESSIISSRYLA